MAQGGSQIVAESTGGIRDWRRILPDTGCEVVDSCFICPLPSCRFDTGISTQLSQARAEEVHRLRFEEGLSWFEVGKRMKGLSLNYLKALASAKDAESSAFYNRPDLLILLERVSQIRERLIYS